MRDVPVSGTGCIASSAFGFSLLFVSIGIFLAAAVPVPAMPCGGLINGRSAGRLSKQLRLKVAMVNPAFHLQLLVGTQGKSALHRGD